jgi:predicted nucleic acid-binding protein
MPTLALIDTTVFVHVLGTDAKRRDTSARVLSAVAERQLDAVVSVESIQELLHVRFRKTGDRHEALQLARSVSEAYRVIGVVESDLPLALELAARNPRIGARDAFILAGALNAGVTNVISSDRGFSGVDEISWIDPADATALNGLLQ